MRIHRCVPIEVGPADLHERDEIASFLRPLPELYRLDPESKICDHDSIVHELLDGQIYIVVRVEVAARVTDRQEDGAKDLLVPLDLRETEREQLVIELLREPQFRVSLLSNNIARGVLPTPPLAVDCDDVLHSHLCNAIDTEV
jgi:hypothetical protein